MSQDFDYNRRIMGLNKRKTWHTFAEYPGGVIQTKEKFVPFHRVVYRVVDNTFGKSQTLESISEAEHWIDRHHGKSAIPAHQRMENL